jgi:hypothetical protein
MEYLSARFEGPGEKWLPGFGGIKSPDGRITEKEAVKVFLKYESIDHK